MERATSAPTQPIGWSIVEANTGEMTKRNAEIRRKGAAALALGILLSMAASVIVANWGFSMGAPVAVLVFVGAAVVFIQRLRSTLGRPLSASVLTAHWMASEGLLDADGRLTPLGDSIASRLTSVPPASPDRRTPQEVAVAAYVEASRLHRSDEPWLQPMVSVVEDVDLSAFEARLRRGHEGGVRVRRILIGAIAVIALGFGAVYAVQVFPGAPGLAVLFLAATLLVAWFATIQWRRTDSS